jgi:hypothetical protein
MGEALAAFYARAEKVGGIKAKVRLAELTHMPSMLADVTDDTEALVARFNAAMHQLIDEFGGTDDIAVSPTSRWEACIDLLVDRHEYIHSRKRTAERVTELTTALLRISRCSIWYLVEEGAALECIDRYEPSAHDHKSGDRLETSQCAPYFEALHREEALVASNARTDPRTACLAESYLEPLGLWSRLDTPIWSKGTMLGIVCSEHVMVKPWSNDDREYALFLGQLVALGEELRTGAYAGGS